MTSPRLHQPGDPIPRVVVPSPGDRLGREELSGAPLGHATLVDAHLRWNIEVTWK